MEWLSFKMWVGIQVVLDLGLIVLVVVLFRSLKGNLHKSAAQLAAQKVIGMIEPLLREADTAAQSFGTQLKEKQTLISRLNDMLDTRIISLNLLLNRSASCVTSENTNGTVRSDHVYDQQASILDLMAKGYDAEQIAGELAMPKGEVELVIDLKKKFENVATNTIASRTP